MLLVGTSKRLNFTVRDLAGNLTNATVSFTATKPGGTTSTPSPTNDSTGQYHVDVSLDQAGRWTWLFEATGAVEVADGGVFDVRDSAVGFLVSLEDAKKQVNITSTDDDEELEDYLAAATQVVEHFVGPIAKRSVVERHNIYGTELVLDEAAAAVPTSITPVTTWSPAVDVSDLYVTHGVVRRTDHALIGDGVYDVTYVAGQTSIPETVGLATRIIFQHLWKTQRGTTSRSGLGGQDTTVLLGYAVPNRALELLAVTPDKAGGFA